jgi:hypothetical protein
MLSTKGLSMTGDKGAMLQYTASEVQCVILLTMLHCDGDGTVRHIDNAAL